MAELKTKETEASVDEFLATLEDETKRADCRRIIELMSAATGAPPKLWGSAIVGFGNRTLKYETGRELDWMIVGFSPRKQNLTLYLSIGDESSAERLARLGKHKTGKGCLYLKRLADVDEGVLNELIEASVRRASK